MQQKRAFDIGTVLAVMGFPMSFARTDEDIADLVGEIDGRQHRYGSFDFQKALRERAAPHLRKGLPELYKDAQEIYAQMRDDFHRASESDQPQVLRDILTPLVETYGMLVPISPCDASAHYAHIADVLALIGEGCPACVGSDRGIVRLTLFLTQDVKPDRPGDFDSQKHYDAAVDRLREIFPEICQDASEHVCLELREKLDETPYKQRQEVIDSWLWSFIEKHGHYVKVEKPS